MKWQFFSAHDFSLHKQAWDWLNRQGPNSVLLESRFVEPLLKHFGTGNEKLAVAGPLHEPVAMAVVNKVKWVGWSTFQPAQAPIGLWLSAAGTSIEELLSSLTDSLPPPTFLFGVTQQDPHLSPCPDNKGHIATLDYIQTAHINVDGSFDGYWSARGKNLRHNLKRQRNRLEREGCNPRLELLLRPEEMTLAVSQFGDLESSGWKGKSGSAIHVDNVQGRFYVDTLSAFAATGHSRVYRYYYGDQLVATDLCVLDNNTLVILKTTYDETIETSSPAMLMRQEVFQSIFAEKSIRRIEFYGKVMDWHTKWSDHFRVMYHVNFYPWMFMKTLKSHLSSADLGRFRKAETDV